MKVIDRLKTAVAARYPSATFDVEVMPSGIVWLDVRVGGQFFVVEYRSTRGYGISAIPAGTGLEGFGDGPDRLLTRYPDAERYLLAIIRRAVPTTKPTRVRKDRPVAKAG